MDQPTLTEFFSSRKRATEGVHPSKRRKLIESHSVVSEAPKVVRRTEQRLKSTLTTKAKPRPTRARNAKSKGKEVLSNDIQRVFLRSGMKKAAEESSSSISEVTSVADEHAVEGKATPSLIEIHERKRKTRAENDSVAEKKAGLSATLSSIESKECLKGGKAVENAESKGENTNTKGRGRGKRGTRTTKQPEKEAIPSEKSSEPEIQPSTDGNETVELVKDKESNNTGQPKESEIPAKSPNKKSSAVRINPGKLKINPWIAEQANVLLSRGQAALLLSQQKQAGSAAKGKTRGVSKQKLGLPENGLSHAKAQEGLEKARQLIKNMRSLETSASKAKGSSTSEKPERLHEVAKRQSTEGAQSSPGVSSPKKVPAHERFHSLAQPTPPLTGATSVTLPLPHKYKVLGEMFNCCDTVLNLLGQRNEACTFDKLKESVQKMCRKRFEKKHLAQIYHLVPWAYDMQYVRVSQKSTAYDLVIQFTPHGNTTVNRVPMTELLARKNNFQNSLLVTTKKHHQIFLQSLENPLTVDDDKIIRWHPQFKLDDVPDVEQSALPEAPVTKIFTTAKDVLERGRGIMPPKVEKALTNVSNKSDETPRIELSYSSKPTEKQTENQTKPPDSTAIIPSALKGVSLDLLNKIRKKQAKKLEEELMRDPVLDKKISMRARLPELCRILKTYFTTEKKAAIPLEDAVIKLSESYSTSLCAGQVDDHIKLLSTLVPEWLAILTVRKCPYIKINKKADINSVIDKVMKTELN